MEKAMDMEVPSHEEHNEISNPDSVCCPSIRYTQARPCRKGRLSIVRLPDCHLAVRGHGNVDSVRSYDHIPTQIEPLDSAVGG